MDAPKQWQDPTLLSFRTGRWRWPWALMGLAAVIAGMIALSIIDLRLFATQPATKSEEIFVAGAPQTYLSMLLFAATIILPTWWVLRTVHGVSARTLLGPDARFDWRLFAKSAAATFVLITLSFAANALRDLQQFTWQPHPWSHIWWLLAAALVVIPQAFAEDFFIKGYLIRTWGAVLPNRALITALVAAFFVSLHSVNADVKADLAHNIIVFFVTELVIIALYFRTLSLAVTTGLHWANNVFALVLIARPPGYPSEFPPLVFTDKYLAANQSRLYDPWAYLELALTVAGAWALLTWRRSPFYLPIAQPSRIVEGQSSAALS